MPLILSKSTLNKADAKLNLENNTIRMLGETIKLINTTSGHCAVPITPNRNMINNLTGNSPCTLPDKVVFISQKPNLTRHEIASQLHIKFAHPNSEQLNKLIELYDLKDDIELKNAIDEVSDECKSCKTFKHLALNRSTSFPLKFNDKVMVDIKCYNETPILLLIDVSTRYEVAVTLKSTNPNEILNKILITGFLFSAILKKL